MRHLLSKTQFLERAMPIKLSKQLHVLLPPIFKMLLRVLIHQLLADEAAVTHLPGTKLTSAPPCPAAMTIRAKKPTCGLMYENCAHDTRAGWREQPVPSAQLNSMFVNQPCAVCIFSRLFPPHNLLHLICNEIFPLCYIYKAFAWMGKLF